MNRWKSAIIAAVLAMPSAALASDWKILSVNGVDVIGAPRVSLQSDGSVTGNTGCNSFTGSGRFENAALVINAPVAVTKMACPDDGLAQQEAVILDLLQGQTAFTHDPFTGAFGLSRGDTSVVLAKDVASIFDAGYGNVYGLKGPLNVRAEPGTESSVVTRVLPGTLLRNLGCLPGDDYDWCNIQFIDASDTTGWVAAEYLQPAPATVRAQEGVFDDVGSLSCRFEADAQIRLCDYAIARDADQSSVLVVYQQDGSERVLHFAKDDLVYVDLESGAYTGNIETSVQDGRVALTLGADYFEISQNLLLGNVE